MTTPSASGDVTSAFKSLPGTRQVGESEGLFVRGGTAVESKIYIDAAMQQDHNNPRPYFLKGQGLKYTTAQFGGGCATAKPQLQIALGKYSTFKPASEISPNWGKEIVEMLIKECNQAIVIFGFLFSIIESRTIN